MQKVRKELLQKTLVYYERFLQQRADDPTVQDELGTAFYRAGRITEEIGSPEKAIAYYQRAQELQEKLLTMSPDDRVRRNALGDTYNALGIALKQGERLDAALESLKKARDIRQQLVALAPHELSYGRALANSVMNIGLVDGVLNSDMVQQKRALQELQDAQKIRDAHSTDRGDTTKLKKDQAMGSFGLGLQELRLNDVNAARDYFKDSIASLGELSAQDKRDLALQFYRATCYRLLGDIADKSSPSKSIPYYQQARDVFAGLVERNPDVAEYQKALAGVYMNMATRQTGANSLDSFEQARRILEGLVKDDPGNARLVRDLAATLLSLGERENEAGQYEKARANVGASLAMLVQLNQRLPNYQDVVQELAKARAALNQMDKEHPPSPPTPAPAQKPTASPAAPSS